MLVEGEGEALNHVWGKLPLPCATCKGLTRWVEIHFEAFVHPGPCTDALWEQYEDAVRDMPPFEMPEEFDTEQAWSGAEGV